MATTTNFIIKSAKRIGIRKLRANIKERCNFSLAVTVKACKISADSISKCPGSVEYDSDLGTKAWSRKANLIVYLKMKYFSSTKEITHWKICFQKIYLIMDYYQNKYRTLKTWQEHGLLIKEKKHLTDYSQKSHADGK